MVRSSGGRENSRPLSRHRVRRQGGDGALAKDIRGRLIIALRVDAHVNTPFTIPVYVTAHTDR